MKSLFRVFCYLLLLSGAAWAQTSGSIRGVVNDSEQQPLPGATVTIGSNALIGGTRTTYTNETGVFRFPSLPVGLYSVEVSMEGFEKVRAENVRVSLDDTANVPLTLKKSTMVEALTVVGDTPLIDVTDSGVSTNYTNEFIQEVPTQRSMWDLMQASPGMSVDYGDSQSANMIAFGSNRNSNSWNIDGLDVTAPETGKAWWYVNPDVIEEIDVIGIGAPAEYGNHTGAVLNVVTKKGSNSLHGGANFYLQTDGLTGDNVVLDPDGPEGPEGAFGFNRDKYHDFAAQIGGPILKDKIWYFGGFQYLRDASTTAGVNPSFAPTLKSDKYDVKVTTLLGKKHEVSGFFHDEIYDYPDSTNPFQTLDATGTEGGDNPGWGATLTSTLSDKLLMELSYTGWWSHDFYGSITNSRQNAFTNYDNEPATYSNGLYYAYDYITYRHGVKGKVTNYADNFLNTQHEFRFGTQYSYGSADTFVAYYGATSIWYYQYGGYLYKVTQSPFEYGAITKDLGFFVDDTVTVNDRLTLNLGVRVDHNTGFIPTYERLAAGTPSISDVADIIKTGEKIPGVDDYITWNSVSPRLGFVWQASKEGHSVIQGSFGVYYDHNVSGNWDSPPPELPTITRSYQDPSTGEFITFSEETAADINFNKDTKPPRTLQYSAGFEQQIGRDSSFGVQYVYKDTKDLIGWEILGGTYEDLPFVDPFTGTVYHLLNIVDNPTLQKGNRPGDFPGGESLRYFQKYHGLVFTYEKRFKDRFLMNASYTWSRSRGLLPDPLGQTQNDTFYSSRNGSDPNQYINANGHLQADRPHQFKLQTIVYHLPGDLQVGANLEFSSGRAFARHIQVEDLNQGLTEILMEPIGTRRYSPIQMVDVSVGRKFAINDRFRLRVDAWIYNLLNSDQELFFSDLALADPSQNFVPDTWVKPRRLQIRLGFEF